MTTGDLTNALKPRTGNFFFFNGLEIGCFEVGEEGKDLAGWS